MTLPSPNADLMPRDQRLKDAIARARQSQFYAKHLEGHDLTTAAELPAAREVLDGPTILQMRRWVREVPLADVVKDYAVRLVMHTHPGEKQGNGTGGLAQKFVLYGSSPRGLQSLILAAKARALFAGRPNVSFDDVRSLLLPSLRHRLILNLEADAEGVNAEKILSEIVAQVAEIE